jgi:hypothetical protein
MAIDAWTVILTAMCTGIGVSMGNGLFEIFFKDYFKRLKKHNEVIRKKLVHNKLIVYKYPWVALLLNVFLWGTGYFYLKRKRILGALLLLVQIFLVGGLSFNQVSLKNTFEAITYSFITVLLSLYLGYDAYNTAKKVNMER